jgi:hypothetical protein
MKIPAIAQFCLIQHLICDNSCNSMTKNLCERKDFFAITKIYLELKIQQVL